jgi:hypothetical protein
VERCRSAVLVDVVAHQLEAAPSVRVPSSAELTTAWPKSAARTPPTAHTFLMPRQLEGEPCALCPTGVSSRTAEHAWPAWLLGMWSAKEGPFTLLRGGEPIRNNKGAPITQDTLTRVKLPACTRCNGILSDRFETQRVRTAVRRLVAANGDADLSEAEAETLGEWLVKTWLFLCHPRALFRHPTWGGNKWELGDENLYSWTVNGQPPPAGLSAWASKFRPAQSDDPEPRQIFLPTVVADGCETAFRSFEAGLVGTWVTLVYHAGWPIAHPLEAEGAAVRMWPRPNRQPVNFTGMPRVWSRDPLWRPGPRLTFRDGTYDPADMPPLSPSLTFHGDFDHSGIHFVEAPRLG